LNYSSFDDSEKRTVAARSKVEGETSGVDVVLCLLSYGALVLW